MTPNPKLTQPVPDSNDLLVSPLKIKRINDAQQIQSTNTEYVNDNFTEVIVI